VLFGREELKELLIPPPTPLISGGGVSSFYASQVSPLAGGGV